MPVVDASIVVDWVAPRVRVDTAAQEALRRWTATPIDIVAPRLLLEEVCNALLTGVRRGRWTGAEADEAVHLLGRLPLRVIDDDADRERAWELARRYDNWPIYDMLYVALAERLHEPLVTANERLRRRLAHLTWIVGPEDG